MACNVHATDQIQELAQTHRHELSQLQARYELRLRSLAARVRGSHEAIVGDKLLMEMSRDPASAVHATERLGELLEKAIASEQEDQIGRLCRELASCEATLSEAQRDAACARRDADDARAALSRLASDAMERRALQASAAEASIQTKRLAEAIGAEQRARVDAETQLSHANRALGSVEAHVLRLQAELEAARQNADAATKAAEERVATMQAAVGVQRERHLNELASAAALLRETGDAAARADGERISQIAALQAALLAARQAAGAAEESARAAEAGRAEASAAVASSRRRAEAAEAAARGTSAAAEERVRAAEASVVAAAAEAAIAKEVAAASAHAREGQSAQERGPSFQKAAEESVRAAEQAAAAQAAVARMAEERDCAITERDAIAERYRVMGGRVTQLMEAERARSADGCAGALRARIAALEAAHEQQAAAHALALSSAGERAARAAAEASAREAEAARAYVQAVGQAHAQGAAEGEERAAAEAVSRCGSLERELAATRAEADARASELASSRDELRRALGEMDAWREEAEERRQALRETERRAEARVAGLAAELRAQATLVNSVKQTLQEEAAAAAADQVRRVTAGHTAALEAVRSELGAAYAVERAKESDCMRALLEGAVGEADARVAAAEAEAAAARAAAEAEASASVCRLETLAEEARRALAAQRAELGSAADRQVSQLAKCAGGPSCPAARAAAAARVSRHRRAAKPGPRGFGTVLVTYVRPHPAAGGGRTRADRRGLPRRPGGAERSL